MGGVQKYWDSGKDNITDILTKTSSDPIFHKYIEFLMCNHESIKSSEGHNPSYLKENETLYE